MSRALNFNPGPATLPLAALERAQKELLDFAGSGMSVIEHSHRGKDYEAVHNEAISLLRELLEIPAGYEVLFLQGGASTQFATIPMNFLTAGTHGAYVLTGAWGEKAFSEGKTVAALYGLSAKIVATSGTGDGKDKSYVRVVDSIATEPGAAYVHLTSNETIHGVQFAVAPGAEFPTANAPLIADMSSDFLWKKLDVSKFSLIYAGAQKNIGPSGVTIVVAKREFLDKGRKDIPKIFQYRTHVENNSLYNTPPTFGIYLVRNVLAWAKESGGLAKLEADNREKGRLLYGTIDGHAGFYKCPVDVASRSLMNVVFRLPSEALEEKFVSEAKKQRMVGLKGHRSVGGIRVSTYNAVSIAWIEQLTEFMKAFAKANG